MTTTTLRFHDTAHYPDLNGPKSSVEIGRLRALGRDIVKTPLHWLSLNLALDAYQSLATDQRVIDVPTTGEHVKVCDLIVSEERAHRHARAAMIVMTAERLGLPASLLATVVTKVLAIKRAQSTAGLARYQAVMKARALDDVQFAYNDDDGYGEVEVWSRKQRLAENGSERKAPDPASVHVATLAAKPEPVRQAAPVGFGARLRWMLGR